MNAAGTAEQVTMQLGALTDEMHQFLAKWHSRKKGETDSAWMQAMMVRCRELSEKAARVRQSAIASWDEFGGNWPRTAKAAERLAANLDKMASSLSAIAQEMQESPRWSEWKRWGQKLSINYEDLLRSVRAMRLQASGVSLRLPHFKPMNFARNAFHMGMGLGAFALSAWVLTPFQAIVVLLSLSAAVGFAEIYRAFSPGFNKVICNLPVFKQTIRPRELHRVNSASVFAWTLTGVTILAPMPAVQIGLLILALADPAASLVGKRWGSRKLWKQKSWAGSGAFFGVAFVCAALGFTWMAGLPAGLSLGLGAVVAFASAGTELLSDRMDDNFTVLGMATAVAGLCMLLA